MLCVHTRHCCYPHIENERGFVLAEETHGICCTAIRNVSFDPAKAKAAYPTRNYAAETAKRRARTRRVRGARR